MDLLEKLRKYQINPQIWDFEIDNDPVYEPPSDTKTDWGTNDNKVDTEHAWLIKKCTAIASNQQQNDLGGPEMAQTIIEHLKLEDDATVQMTLVELLGFDELDFVSEVLARRASLTQPVQQPGMTASQREEWKRQNRLKAIEKASNLVWQDSIDPQFPHVYKLQKETTALEIVNAKRVLPAGTTRTSMPGYEHVVIPAQTHGSKFEPVLLKIEDLDNECRITFSKYTTLNKMQSLVFPVCYETNENMLICAPTGAGKTDIALLSCINTIKVAMNSEESWKIVYVAPLKALAAEITEKLGSKLAWMGVKVRELTGDMQLSRSEIAATHVLVTTPEKWDVVTRKPNDDSGLSTQLRLLIIDEVHLLHEERGAVLESIVARTWRQVESQQRPIRILGLSATLPNFVDVAEFLGVNPQRGLFFFDQSFRPVPLEQQFFGVKNNTNNPHTLAKNLDRVAFEECLKYLRLGHSVMIFVHSRRDTTKTAQTFMTMAQKDGLTSLFVGENSEEYSRDMRQFSHRGMQELYQSGFATHHAGMSRSERNMSEKLFSGGGVRVLVSTATLAWGVNLPAAVVIIKGTQVYDAQHGGYVDLGISDVIQIFGRAGRPQFEQTGTGILCTGSDKLDHYLDAITNQYPIESRFLSKLPEHLNAEIALGTVSTVSEACQWLGYTYMFVRMRRSPQTYGLLPKDLQMDPQLMTVRRKLVLDAVRLLRDTQMIIFDDTDEGESLVAKDVGRIASEFYLLRSTVEQFNSTMTSHASEQQLIQLLSKSEDFSGLKVRPEELTELDKALSMVPFDLDLSSSQGKTSLLLQAWIGRLSLQDTALQSDMAYVAQNSARIIRAFFLLCVSRGWAEAASAALALDKSLCRRSWPYAQHPLLQMTESMPPATIERHLSSSKARIGDLKLFSSKEFGDLVHNHGWGPRLVHLTEQFPLPAILLAEARPLTEKVVQLRIKSQIIQPFSFDRKVHGNVLYFYLFVHIMGQLMHTDKMMVTSQNALEIQTFEFAVPYLASESPVIVQLVSDAYVGADTITTVDFSRLKLPTTVSLRTDLLKLRPLSVCAWDNSVLEKHYGSKFRYFNPMQTMVFHSLYHTKENVLLGSPTGSGKTVACEIAIWAALRDRPTSKVVYIAPMKALVRERVTDWTDGICQIPFLPGSKRPKLVEMTGDTQPTSEEIRSASIIITTPEKFDGVSRNFEWVTREVSLVIMDEVHLLASDRGAILEVIVSRLNRSKHKDNARLLGMSTAVANAGDLASWLGIKTNAGVFNFPSSVRPVPLEMYIDGFADVQGGFCPLMKSMNKPAYLAMRRHSPSKPIIVFVASRRQTRLTALDLIALCASEDHENVKRWLKMSDTELQENLLKVKDETLRHTLQYGVAIHHAGLEMSDRKISHELFAAGKVQVLVATSTLAWGVNLPAFLVIVKGTQFFDAKTNKYQDMDLTDVLQMMGRAGRPAFDTSGVAVVFTKQRTKQFYKYFLNLGFPVESSLHKPNVLENHLGAEISAGRVKSLNEALEFLTHTFLFRRVHSNPSYYTDPGTNSSAPEPKASNGEANGESSPGNTSEEKDTALTKSNKAFIGEDQEEPDEVRGNRWLVERVQNAFTELHKSQCLLPTSTDIRLRPTPLLNIASFYYVSHLTMRGFVDRIHGEPNAEHVLQTIALASEYDELAIRHNEDILNTELSKKLEYPAENLELRMVDPHVKAFLLMQARMCRVSLPIEDYIQDTVTVLDQSQRIFQALIDTAAQMGNLNLVLMVIKVLRAVKQGLKTSESMIKLLPGVQNYDPTIKLQDLNEDDASRLGVPNRQRDKFSKSLAKIPRVEIKGTKAVFKPLKRSVFCPNFYRSQRESWFVIVLRDNYIVSMERVQRAKSIEAQLGQQLIIMSDTCEVDYIINN